MLLGLLGANTGRTVSEDIAGRYQPVTVYRRKSSKLGQVLRLGFWIIAPAYIIFELTGGRWLVAVVEWVREAPAEQVAGGIVALVIFGWVVKLIDMGLKIVQDRHRLVYVTSANANELRSPEALVFADSRPKDRSGENSMGGDRS